MRERSVPAHSLHRPPRRPPRIARGSPVAGGAAEGRGVRAELSGRKVKRRLAGSSRVERRSERPPSEDAEAGDDAPHQGAQMLRPPHKKAKPRTEAPSEGPASRGVPAHATPRTGSARPAPFRGGSGTRSPFRSRSTQRGGGAG